MITTLKNSPELHGTMHEGVESVPVDPNTWDEIVANFGQSEKDALGRVAELRGELHEVFRENPAEAIIAEATNFATLYYSDRLLLDSNGDSVFFTSDTRNPNSRNLDSVTTIKDKDGITSVVVDMVMDYGYDQLFRISVDTTGLFGVQKLGDSGNWVSGEVHNPREIDHIIAKYVDMSITAAGKVRERTPQERDVADLDAQDRYYRSIGKPKLTSL